jgi:hypothetical protein
MDGIAGACGRPPKAERIQPKQPLDTIRRQGNASRPFHGQTVAEDPLQRDSPGDETVATGRGRAG